MNVWSGAEDFLENVGSGAEAIQGVKAHRAAADLHQVAKVFGPGAYTSHTTTTAAQNE
jgi:hypothetical protein